MSLMRLLRFLTILAMLFSPVSMMSGHAAMAMPAPSATAMDHMQASAPAGHCADMAPGRDSNDQQRPDIDCMIACSAIPAADFAVETHAAKAAFLEPARLVSALRGLHPESDPPPPRFS